VTPITKAETSVLTHEAIRPSNLMERHAGDNDDQQKLYTLIWERTIASQMAPAQTLRTRVTASPTSHTEHIFSASGSVITFDGWLRVIEEHEDDERTLPSFEIAESVTLAKLTRIDKETQPPNRYSEAGLVKELEKRGIGRPSTYASIISTIEERGYIEKQNRTLFPTDTGMVVSGFLEEHFTQYISDTFTAEMEDSLDDIGDGVKEYAKTLDSFYKPFSKVVKEKTKTSEKITDLGAVPEEFKCPLCDSPMVFKLSRNGTFMSCSRFPDCKGARKQNGEIMLPDAPLGTNPSNGNTIYVKEGRFGVYVEETDGAEYKKRASVPPSIDRSALTIEQALTLLSLPRIVGAHPEGGEITASAGRFGPYVHHNDIYASIKAPDDVYTIGLERAVELLTEKKNKPSRRGRFSKKKIEKNSETAGKKAASNKTKKSKS
jgi:DNA topoisomerase I